MQPCTEARPATVGSTSAIRVRNGANELNGAPEPPYSLPTKQAPIAGCAQIGEDGFGDFAVVVEQRAGRLVPLDDGDRIVHHLLHVGRRLRRRAHEQFDRHAAVPHGPMRRTVHRLVLRREQRFDLVVGRVDRAGAAGFVGALAAERERGFGE